MKFYDIKENSYILEGLLFDEKGFFRMPRGVAENVSDGVRSLYTNTAGGRLHFVTSSPEIKLKITYPAINLFYHMPMTGKTGFDVYASGRFAGIAAPQSVDDTHFEGSVYLGEPAEREVTVNFPLYEDVSELVLGVDDGYEIKAAPAYKKEGRIVYYGSSITQGGCASRPGNAYESMISRALNMDYLNLGFSGSCRAEDAMCDYISSLPMKIFVYDYDHNAPNAEFLEKTHEHFFLRFREKQPKTPVVMLSAIDFGHMGESGKRRDIIRRTYSRAFDSGDKNVYFVDGRDFLAGLSPADGTVDGTHPNDLGFYGFAKALIPLFSDLL